jgi:hypothetical protein
MRKIKECLKENDLFFRWIDKQTYGLIEEDKQEITINIELLILEVMIHEYLHWRFPDKKERWIEKETDRRLKKMTRKEIQKYIRYIFRKARLK